MMVKKIKSRKDLKNNSKKSSTKSNTFDGKLLILLGFILIIVGLISFGIIIYSKVPKIDDEGLNNEVFSAFKSSCGTESLSDSNCFVDIGKKLYLQNFVKRGFSVKKIIVEGAKEFGLYSLKDDMLSNDIYAEFQDNPPKERPLIIIDPEEVNLHEVNQSAVSYVINDFNLKNEGNSSLTITGVETTCSCLSVEFIQGRTTHPRFGRFSSPFGWSLTLEPGEEIIMRVYFDPRINAWERGFQNRWVYVYSNDPLTPKKIINVQYTHVV